MTPSVRDMITVTATWSEADGRWTLPMPDGRIVTAKRAWILERVVRRELPGTVLRLRYDPGEAAAVRADRAGWAGR